MNKAAGVLKMYWRDKWSWIYIPWIICLSSFLINLIVGYVMPNGSEFYTGGISALYIYLFVAGIVTPVQTFPFALGMGVRRKDYFIGTTAMAAIFSVGSATLLILFSLLEQWSQYWGIGLHFFHLPFVHDGPLLLQWLTMLLLLMFVYFAGFFIASIYRRFGRIGLFTFFGFVLLIVLAIPLVVKAWGSWAGIGRWMAATFHSMYELAPLFLICTLVLSVVSYMMFRRATV